MSSNADHLARMYRAVAEEHPHRVATRIKRDGTYLEQTYAQLIGRVRRFAAGLVARGIRPGDRIALLANNRPEWTEADLAALSVGAIVVPIFPSSTPDQIRHIIADSGSRGLVIDGPAAAAKLSVVRDQLPDLEFVTAFDPVSTPDALAWEAFGSDDAAALADVDRRVAAASPDDVATIIYTSGTTGVPKGVVLQHRAFLAELRALDVMFSPGPDEHSLCFLPLSHALERGWTYYVMSRGCANTYLDDPKKIAEALVDVRPTLFVTVPGLYDKVYATARERAARSAFKKTVFDWAVGLGGRLQQAYRAGRRPPWWQRAQLPLADALVLRSVRDAVGGPKAIMAAGGAPLRREVEEFFSACGLLVCQGYGLTEAAPLVSFNSSTRFCFGTVGQVLPGGELRLGPDDEIFYRGPNLMQGYWKDPEATAQVIDADGFLHTGDVGSIDERGFLTITDRLKDLLVTSNGKNVAPQPIESLIMSDPLFQHAVVLGDNRPVLTLLVKPSWPDLEALAQQLQIRWENRDELPTRPEVVEAIKTRVATLTDKLPSHEQIRDIRVLIDDFTQENGLLTPTMKVRRREVEKQFHDAIEDMYARLAELRKSASRK